MEKTKKQFYLARCIDTFVVSISLLAIIYLVWIQLSHINSFAGTWDQVDFVLALDRFDLMSMQPHFPGYPFFILAGNFIHRFIEDNVASLTILNMLLYLTALFPMYKLSRFWNKKSYSILITAVLYSSTYVLVIVNQPISEGAAISCLWWYVWSLNRALNQKNHRSVIMPILLLAVLLGIRVSYLPFAIGVLYLFYMKRKQNHISIRQIMGYLLMIAATQFIWVTSLILSEGSIIGFFKLSLAFTSGHFNDWGNTAIASDLTFIDRMKAVIVDNLLWSGISSQLKVLAVLQAILFFVMITGVIRYRKNNRNSSQHLYFIMIFCYLIWALLGQNADKPRHILPLVGFLLFLVLSRVMSRGNRGTVILVSLLLGGQVYYSQLLIKVQAQQAPATLQLADYLRTEEKDSIVYTWEETRVFEYVNLPLIHKRIQTYEFFLQDVSNYEGKTILITDKAVNGFISQGVDLSGNIKKIKTFHSNKLFDPVYADVTLYKWKE
jgi:hypothetical protein